jgi:hypothetical protein
MQQFYDFVILYVLSGLWTLIALPRKRSNRILEALFPMLRRF